MADGHFRLILQENRKVAAVPCTDKQGESRRGGIIPQGCGQGDRFASRTLPVLV